MFDPKRRPLGRMALALTLSTTLFTLGACGGGGGGPQTKVAPSGDTTTVTVRGSLSLVETASVDSDTNDPNQANRRDNNDFDVAQKLVTPVHVVGAVNLAGEGPDGPNWDAGDDVDGFEVQLEADQTVELEFAADPSVNDVDLYIFDDRQNPVGISEGESTSECVRISQPGRYFVAVYAYAGAAVYNLRIGSPGSSRDCANATDSQPTQLAASTDAAGRLVALPRSRASALRATGGQARPSAAALTQLAGLRMDAAPSLVPTLIHLPDATQAGNTGLNALRQSLGLRQPTADTTTPARSAVQRWATRWPAATRTLQLGAYAKTLRHSGQFQYVERDRPMALTALVNSFPPNDPSYPDQRWHYEQINLPAAMGRLMAMPSAPTLRPIVAVIDSGIMVDHPDFDGQMVGGRTFYSARTNGDLNSDDPNDPTPRPEPDNPGYHGTHVAGTIAARTWDGFGAAGVAPMALLMPLRVFDPSRPTTSSFDVSQAMLYAAGLDNNSGRKPLRRADVINLSLGGNGACPAIYQDAIQRVRAAGVIVVAASGNDARNNLGQPVAVGAPANCAGVVSVGALDIHRNQTRYSQSGPNLMVSAPGGDVTVSSTGSSQADLITSTLAAFTTNGVRVPGVGLKAGTSMATPHVAGVIALMKYANPAFTPGDFDAWLLAGRLTDDVNTPGRDNATGMGLINARKAIDQALGATTGGGTAPKGEVTASPFALDFGSNRDSMALSLLTTATTDEVVQSITPSSALLSVQALGTDIRTGLGDYLVRVDRSQMPANTTAFPTLTVRTSARVIVVNVTVLKLDAASHAGRAADYGQIYVLAIDTRTGETLDNGAARHGVSAQGGRYDWSFTDTVGREVILVAGADLDHNGYICESGEPCGGFPLLSSSLSPLTLSPDLGVISFSLSPMGTGDVQVKSLSPAGGAAATRLGPFKLR